MNISEIAKLAGVSKTTVSRILNNSEHVSDKTREAVLQVIRNNNYAPSSLAQGLAKNENSAIGVVIPEIDNEFFSEVLSGINDVIDKHNLSMICCDTNNNTDREAKALKILSQQRVQGIIITPDVHDRSSLLLWGVKKGSNPLFLLMHKLDYSIVQTVIQWALFNKTLQK